MTRNLPPTAPTAVPLHFKIRKVSDIKPVVAWLHMFSKLQSLRLKYLCQQRRPADWLGGVKEIRNWSRSGGFVVSR